MQPLVRRAVPFAALAAMLAATASPLLAAPVTVEHYYRIKWGSGSEFRELYKRNHEPILKEMQKQGFMKAIPKSWDDVFLPLLKGRKGD